MRNGKRYLQSNGRSIHVVAVIQISIKGDVARFVGSDRLHQSFYLTPRRPPFERALGLSHSLVFLSVPIKINGERGKRTSRNIRPIFVEEGISRSKKHMNDFSPKAMCTQINEQRYHVLVGACHRKYEELRLDVWPSIRSRLLALASYGTFANHRVFLSVSFVAFTCIPCLQTSLLLESAGRSHSSKTSDEVPA